MLVTIGSTKADVRVRAVMSMPRLSFTANHMVWWKALLPLGIEPEIVSGAFWNQCLTRSMKNVIDSCEYILTLDYDSFILRQDVEELFSLAMVFQCDALAPFQTKREDGRPMVTPLGTFKPGQKSGPTTLPKEWFLQPVQEVDAAHFGCTVISTAALKRCMKPWFHGQPNADGEWEDGRIDDDMAFWAQWRASGLKVHVTPRVVIGHGEYGVTWPGASLQKPVYQSAHEFTRTGKKPEGIWHIEGADDDAEEKP